MCHWSFKTSESQCCGVLFCTPAASWRRPSVPTLQPGGPHSSFWLDSTYCCSFPQWVTHPFLTPKPVRGQIFNLIRNSVEGEGSFEALVIKNPPASEGDMRDSGSIHGLGTSPGVGNSTVARSSILTWEIHGQKSLVGYSQWGCKESDTTERVHTHTHTHTHTHASANSIMSKIELNNLKRWSFGDEKHIWMVCREN